MSRERTIRRAVEREFQKQRERDGKQQTNTPLAKMIVRVLGSLATLFGVYVGFLNLVPRITVTPQAALVSSDAFSAPFVVSNDGFLPVYDVHCFCSPRKVRYRKPGSKGGLDITTEGADENETGGVEAPFIAKKLSPGQRATFPCPFPNQFPAWLVSADIGLVVVYNAAPWPPIRRHQMNRFSLSRDTAGEYHWLEMPLE